MLDITVEELKAQLGKVQLVDVREPFEHEICSIKGDVLIPIRELELSLGELDSDKPTVLYCHSGNRSMHAAMLLRSKGFMSVRSLKGGIDEWAEKIEPGMERY